MNEATRDQGGFAASNTFAWAIAAIACMGSAAWLGWLWMNPPADLSTARLYVEGKAWERAMPMLDRLAAADPKNSEITRLQADCLVHLDRYDEAARLLEN